MNRSILACAVLLLGAAQDPGKVDLAEVLPLSDRILMVHIVDGHVVHHGKGQQGANDRAIVHRIDTAKAETWSIASNDDPEYKGGKAPGKPGRQSRGCDFAGIVEGWVDGHTVNKSPDHALEHWISLPLPSPLKRGATYTVTSGDLVPALTLKFDEKT